MCEQLGIKGVPTRLKLSAMFAENKLIQSNKVSGLVVRGFNEQKPFSCLLHSQGI